MHPRSCSLLFSQLPTWVFPQKHYFRAAIATHNYDCALSSSESLPEELPESESANSPTKHTLKHFLMVLDLLFQNPKINFFETNSKRVIRCLYRLMRRSHCLNCQSCLNYYHYLHYPQHLSQSQRVESCSLACHHQCLHLHLPLHLSLASWAQLLRHQFSHSQAIPTLNKIISKPNQISKGWIKLYVMCA